MQNNVKEERISPHALMYRRWAKPVGKLLVLSVGSYYTLFYLWEYLERKELEYEKKTKRV